MLQTCEPNYANSIVRLMQTLGTVMQHPHIHSTTSVSALEDETLQQQLQEAQHILLLVIDGCGFQYLKHEHSESFFYQSTVGSMHSVFPTSTAPAISSYLSGLSPIEHGVQAWHQWLPNAGLMAAPLPFHSRCGEIPLQEMGLNISDCFKVRSFYESLPREAWVYSPEFIIDSTYNAYATRGSNRIPFQELSALTDKVTQVSTTARGKTFQYLYWPQFDHLCHKHGLAHSKTRAHFLQIDQFIEKLAVSLKNQQAILLVTADHGMIDTQTEHRLKLTDFPDIAQLLDMPLSGEPRVAFCRVSANHHSQFEQLIQTQMKDACTAYPTLQLIEAGWFGEGTAEQSLQLKRTLGDYILVMKDHYTLIDQLPGEKEKGFIGMHGGISSEEMLVPLAFIHC